MQRSPRWRRAWGRASDMPDKSFDLGPWIYNLLTSHETRLAFWAGIGGAARVIAMRRAGAPVTLFDATSTIFLAVVFGVAFYPVAGRLVEHIIGPTIGAALALKDDQMLPATVIVLGLIGAGAFGFFLDFSTKWFETHRGPKP